MLPRLVSNLAALLALTTTLVPVQAGPLCFAVESATACVYSTQDAGDALIRIEYPPQLGWVAFGLGTGMNSADVMMAYALPDGSISITRRSSSGHFLPTLASTQDLTITNSSSSSSGNVVTFRRPLAAASASTPSIQQSTQPLIWAGYTGSPPTSPGAIPQHTVSGVASGNLLDGSMAFAHSSPSAPPPTIVTGDDGSRDRRLRIIHGTLMAFAWVGLAPAAILIARFGKKALGVWWFRIHFTLFGLCAALTYAAFAIVYRVVADTGENHYDYSASGIHVILGLLVVILTAPQAFLGIVIDKLWSPTRKSIPWRDKLHWWLGRLTFLLAVINIPFGIALFYRDDNNNNRPAWPYILYALLLGAAVVAFVGLAIKSRREAAGHHVAVASNDNTGHKDDRRGQLDRPTSAQTLDPARDIP
ncbi:hypothetical protein HDU87_000366 [Geranomyces variabilis]|uniref:Cytochrome b561 domain-containing protein n=1 Tax=Geranomyces variabilis TaxID=109894 RepID=A0AAD5XT50_9FUNG|nr:hypothetical protein HDU87_000366 [Geranomyces variabilis]